jgi:hypothetical protein
MYITLLTCGLGSDETIIFRSPVEEKGDFNLQILSSRTLASQNSWKIAIVQADSFIQWISNCCRVVKLSTLIYLESFQTTCQWKHISFHLLILFLSISLTVQPPMTFYIFYGHLCFYLYFLIHLSFKSRVT